VRVVALVLAAGAASRFGGDKLAARLGGQSLLDHVLARLRSVPLSEIVVVTRPDRPIRRQEGLRVVVNPSQDEGLSSSVRAGVAAIQVMAGPPVDVVVIALADQPRIDPDVVRRLLEAAKGDDRPIVVPAYDGDDGRNPVVLGRSGFALVDGLSGDRGLGAVIEAHPELVLVVPVSGANPDVDTPADLARLRL